MPTFEITGSATPSPLTRFCTTGFDLVLHVGRDRRDFFGRLQLEQHACSALQVETEVDLLLDREDRPDAQPHHGQEEDRLNAAS